LAGASFLVPIPEAVQDKEAFSSTFASVVLINGLSIGTCLLFLLGLGGFTTTFRRVYFLICGGLITQAIGSLVYLGAVYTGTLQSGTATVLAEVPLALGITMIFWAFVNFARLLQLRL
ncbi:MAG: hypothetical protein AAB834_07120, partial [Patescibacteria group bacterium]